MYSVMTLIMSSAVIKINCLPVIIRCVLIDANWIVWS